ncbi:alpha/beta hydrolase family esterase [Litoreibacter arenae]|uniref:Putative ESTERASE LIPOPROTEIN LPQC n=1 Tax=Litoreibacter arenae DSM 19593 TaxID=1123360 RepID=S9QC99_9RHOB|nr:prolyl oligopeptidase family serine peptidase [Litoreibacter arenae]EPX77213.1 putative ESTERASE LIPOPROTEIN LPQC [Litoreibacter arenae DSM 19593]
MNYYLPLVFAAVLSVLAAPAQACGPDSDCILGDRTYRIAMPASHDGTTPVGAIVFAHGYKGSAAGLMGNRNLRRTVSDMGLAFIALKSKGDDWVLPNAPRHMDSDGAEEFAYVDAVIADAASRAQIDTGRMMAAGFSAGGMMVWNLACARPDLFAGFAPISGTFWKGPPKTCVSPAASIIHIHGDSDPTVPLDGRPILNTRQGKVSEALAMYRDFGDFGESKPHNTAQLICQNSTNDQGAVLDFCLFQGGHSFRSDYLRHAWSRLKEAGHL